MAVRSWWRFVLVVGVFLGACTTAVVEPQPTTVVTVITVPETSTTRAQGAPHQRVIGPEWIDWGPDLFPDAETFLAISGLLDEFDAWMLWPEQPPPIPEPVLPEGVEAPAEGAFRVSHTLPQGSTTVFWMLNSPFWSIDWISGDGGRSCYGAFLPVTVRDNQGCIRHLDTGPTLVEWLESDRTMRVQASGFDDDTLLSWLATWREVPNQ